MIKLNIKPLSVNEAWQGRRFKTNKYKKYIKDMMKILPNLTIPDGYLYLRIEFGFSNSSSDFDNPVKCFVDCLQKRYMFNDKMIKKCTITINPTKKAEEYIKFNIKPLE